MKKSFLTFLAIVTLCLNMNAQRGNKGKKTRDRPEAKTEQSSKSQRSNAKPMSLNPRVDRKIAIASDSGIKSMTGVGLSASYYVTKNIAVDAGAGVGLAGLRVGARGRYLFLDKKFSPYIGVGVFRNLTTLDNIEFDDGTDFFLFSLEPSTYAQGLVGFEFMGNNGFVIGLNLGYSRNFNENPWTTSDSITADTRTALDLIYGSGLATGFRIGWAF